MTLNPTTDARELIIAALKDATDLTASFVPADQIYPNKTPASPVKPYLRLGPMQGDVQRPSGWEGSEIDGAVHMFAAPTEEHPDAEAFVNDALGVVAGVIDALPFAFIDRTLSLPDAKESDVWHGIVFYKATLLSDAA